MGATKSKIELDGRVCCTLEDFYDEVSRKVAPDHDWGRNLDAFDDMLRGGYGTPKGGFCLLWTHSDASRQSLGYAETVRQLSMRLGRCHPENRALVELELAAARECRGPTVFDWLVEIIREHADIELVLR